MGIMDEFETGPVEGLKPIAMRDPYALQLTPQDLVILAGWVRSPAYAVWQKLSEGVIEKAETAHFQNWKDREAFERTGLVAVAQRMFYEQLQQEAKKQVDEFAGEIDFARKKQELLKTSPEDQILKEFQ